MVINVKANPQKTILASLEEMGVTVTTQCKSGYCSACRCQLKKGVVVHREDALVASEDDVLPCSSFAVTPVQLEVDA